jgi:hypothetical protein
MWGKFKHKQSSLVVFVAVCYSPPTGSSWDMDVEELFLLLGNHVQRFKLEGQVVVCGDFNARWGGLNDILEDSGTRCSVDTVTNDQGEMLVECMKSVDLCFVNRRRGGDELTCISSKSVLWWIIVWSLLTYVL